MIAVAVLYGVVFLGLHAHFRWALLNSHNHARSPGAVGTATRAGIVAAVILTSAQFYSNIRSGMRGPFDPTIEWMLGDRTAHARQERFTVSNRPVAYSLNAPAPRYRVRVMLDGNLANLGDFDERDESGLLF